MLATSGEIVPRHSDGSRNIAETTVSTQAGQLSIVGRDSGAINWSIHNTLAHETLPNRYIQASDRPRSNRSASQPPRKFPSVIPANTTPITEVHVYSDEPTVLAISREAVSSNVITQTLVTNTSAL